MTPVSSLETMAAATILASFTGPDVPEWMLHRIDQGLGGVCLFGSNLVPPVAGSPLEQATQMTEELHGVRPSVVVALDEEGGAVTRLEASRGSSVPGNAALGAVDDPDLTRRVAGALGRMLLTAGIDLDLAPCADVNVEGTNPVIGVRSFGTDPVAVSRHVAAYVEGLQSAGVSACAKHFPGHGATVVDSHLDLPVVEATPELLSSRELAPFRAAVAASVSAIMTAHLRLPAVDDVPATISERILHDLLRIQMGFRGAIVTDALDMEGIGGPRSIPGNVVRALVAGADFCCLGPDANDDLVAACIDAVMGAVRSGALDEERLADAAGRVAAVAPLPQGLAGEVGLSEVGRLAARRALRIEGELAAPGLRGAHVVELRREVMIAAGLVPWGIAEPLTELDPTTTSEWLGTSGDIPAALQRAEGRDLIVVVRDPQCDERTAALLADLLQVRPDAVVVDMGWPVPALEDQRQQARAWVTTYGPSRVSGEVVARVLSGAAAPVEPIEPIGGARRGA